eukprot:352736-Chlamydomonas_euryale.AAC.3
MQRDLRCCTQRSAVKGQHAHPKSWDTQLGLREVCGCARVGAQGAGARGRVGCKVWGARCRVQGVGCKVWAARCGLQGVGCK